MILAAKFTSGIAEGRAGWGTLASGSRFVRRDGNEGRLCEPGSAAAASGDLALSCLRSVLVEEKMEGVWRSGDVSATCITSFASRVAMFATGRGSMVTGATFVRTDE